MDVEVHEVAADAAARRAAVTRGLVYHAILTRDLPVSSVLRYRRDVVTVKKLPDGIVSGKSGRNGKDRAGGRITEFSFRSRYRLLHTVKNADCDFHTMATLTYPAEFPASGRIVKGHLKTFFKRLLRQWPGVQGVWFLEFQRRGAPHFHVLLSLKLWEVGELVERKRHFRGQTKIFRTVPEIQEMVSRWWFEIVGSGDEKHLRAGCAVEQIEEQDGALRYAACHASKPHQKDVPEGFEDVGRFWGVVGGVHASCLEVIPCETEEIFDRLGAEAMSRKGRVKKYLWDAAGEF